MKKQQSFDSVQASTALDYMDFQKRFALLANKHPKLIVNTLSNIFTMRLIGNKTHGDLAEVGMAEFIRHLCMTLIAVTWGRTSIGRKSMRKILSSSMKCLA
ncbi:MAG: hypothetical protein IJP82_02885 [Bacteroidaceae bacterium]|nr:hypothetical protein [Bacteroidaceae bacterium]